MILNPIKSLISSCVRFDTFVRLWSWVSVPINEKQPCMTSWVRKCSRVTVHSYAILQIKCFQPNQMDLVNSYDGYRTAAAPILRLIDAMNWCDAKNTPLVSGSLYSLGNRRWWEQICQVYIRTQFVHWHPGFRSTHALLSIRSYTVFDVPLLHS